MGFFSWRTSDTHASISNKYSSRHAFAVKMLDNQGNEWEEKQYEGYGDFGGRDYYELLAHMNGLVTRSEGIRLAHSGEACLRPKLVTASCSIAWSALPDSTACEYQGYFYPEFWEEAIQ